MALAPPDVPGEVDVGLVGKEVALLLLLIAALVVVVVAQLRELRRRSAAGQAGTRPPREGDIMMICGPDLVAEDVAPASQPLLGYRPETLRGKAIQPLVHSGDWPVLSAFAAHPGPEPVAARLRHHDGPWVWLLAGDATRRGRPGAVEIYPRAVAERVRAEEWIAARRTMADVVLMMASDAFIATDEWGRIVDWNRTAEQVLGWPRDEVIGRNAVDLVIPEPQRDAYRARLRDLMQGQSVRVDDPTQASVLRRDGGELPVEATAWTVQVGRTRQLNVLLRDMTERRHVEQALREARQQALDASRLKSEFLATMSHEIRTPMNGVIGLSGLLLGTELDANQRRYAEGIRTAGDALLEVINDVLDFSKVEAGKLSLVEVDFDLRELVEDVVEVVAEPARSKGLELYGYVRPGVPVALRGDPGRLRQILLNLAGNAVKFTDHGEVVIRAERAAGSAPEGEVAIRFEVADTGIGIAPQAQDRLFDAFAQGDASATRRFGGTGLGLAITRRLVDLMHGQVGVTSEVGVGSTFWCEIALRRREVGRPAPSAAQRDLDGLRVLVVDNNATNRLILADQMLAWRMAPSTVDSGPAALAELVAAGAAGNPYDLAVVDMAMPAMDGIELARRIAAEPAIPPVHVVLLSSTPDLDGRDLREAGVAARLTKPVHQSQLFDCLARVLGSPTPTVEAPMSTEDKTVRGRVLLAEDNDINQQVAVAILRQLHYDVDVAEDGQQALDLAGRGPYDAILMDCQMPVMDGYAAAEQLRRRESASGGRTPIIALTASALAEDRDRSLAAGMDDHLAKPIRPDQLREMLQRWIAAGPEQVVRGQLDARLAEIRGIDPDAGEALVRTLVDAFIERAPAAIAAITADLRGGDGAAAGAQAHKLQGMAGNLGALRLAETSAAVSRAAQAGQPDPHLLDRLSDDLDLAMQAMRAVRASF